MALLSTRRESGTNQASDSWPLGFRSLLDAAPVNVMAADTAFNLVYINPWALETLRGLDTEIRRSFKLGTNDLLGGSIHRMHKDPARIERILRDPASFPHRADIRFESVVLRATWNMIPNGSGGCAGYVAVWESVGDKEVRAKEMAVALVGASRELDDSSDVLRAVSAESSDQAGSVAAATEEMSMTVREISQHTSQAAQVASEAVSAAVATLGVVDRLGRSSGDIVAVLTMITEIAAQTNLLALNATIEAARAGESGRGFAVVAHEVKELARRTASATSEIQDMVSAIGSDVTEVAASIAHLHGVVESISELQSSVAAAVEEQSATTEEIAKSASYLHRAAGQSADVADAIQRSSATLGGRVSELEEMLTNG